MLLLGLPPAYSMSGNDKHNDNDTVLYDDGQMV